MAGPGTEFVYLRGKVKWVRTKQVNPWGKWTVTLYPDGPSLEAIRQLQAEGAKNVLKKDEDGYFCSFNRPSEKTDKSGRKYGLTPVEVLDREGKPFDGLIGNNSDATIKLEVYKHKTPGGGTAKAARLLSLRIDNLVEYSPDSMDEDQLRAIKGFDKQAPQERF